MICGLLCMIFSVTNGNDLKKADSLFNAGRYEESALEFERVWFHAALPALRDAALIGKGDALKAAGYFPDAALTYSRVPADGRSDSVIYLTHYGAALCAYLAGDISMAAIKLARMREYLRDSSWRDRSLFLEVIILSESENWEECYNAFSRYCKLRNKDSAAFHVIRSDAELRLKSEKKALFLSLFLPGAGQWYAGKPGRGFSSFILSGAAVAYGVISAFESLWITAFFTGFTYTLRFYSGGARYAMQCVRAYNEGVKRQYKNSLRDTVLKLEGSF